MKKTYNIPRIESVYMYAAGSLLLGSGEKTPGGTTDPTPTIVIPGSGGAPARGDMPSY